MSITWEVDTNFQDPMLSVATESLIQGWQFVL